MKNFFRGITLPFILMCCSVGFLLHCTDSAPAIEEQQTIGLEAHQSKGIYVSSVDTWYF